MLKIFPRALCLLLCILLLQDTNAQVNTKLVALKKDTAYKRFQSQLATIMQTAKGRRTNYTAAKALFDKNKTMLDGLKKRYGLAVTPIMKDNSNKLAVVEERPLARLTNISVMGNIYEYAITGPFTKVYKKYRDVSMKWDTTSSGNKINFTSTNDEFYMGPVAFGYSIRIGVPNTPQIVGVRVEFEYSYFTTGWDNDNGEFVTELCVHASNSFNSPAYQSLPLSTVLESIYENLPGFYRKAGELYRRDFSRMGDYIFSKEGRFSIEGYVTPGEVYYLGLAAGYTEGSHLGNWEAYHYGEFTLKKVSVKFLKAGE